MCTYLQIGLKQGLEMLNIFRSYTPKTSLLDDFNFYENREKSLQAKRSNKPASLKIETYDDGDIPVSFYLFIFLFFSSFSFFFLFFLFGNLSVPRNLLHHSYLYKTLKCKLCLCFWGLCDYFWSICSFVPNNHFLLSGITVSFILLGAFFCLQKCFPDLTISKSSNHKFCFSVEFLRGQGYLLYVTFFSFFSFEDRNFIATNQKASFYKMNSSKYIIG